MTDRVFGYVEPSTRSIIYHIRANVATKVCSVSVRKSYVLCFAGAGVWVHCYERVVS